LRHWLPTAPLAHWITFQVIALSCLSWSGVEAVDAGYRLLSDTHPSAVCITALAVMLQFTRTLCRLDLI
jgi:hypothetical protein